MVRAGSIEEVQAAVRSHARLRPVGGRTKPALSADAAPSREAEMTATPAGEGGSRVPERLGASDVPQSLSARGEALDAAAGRGEPVLLDVSQLSGVLDYSAAECTFSARAGTTIAEIEQMLARDGLYLPFEPPFGDRGATLGGTVAAGLSGPGRLRYGGVRDFLLGVRFVDGEGRVAQGGGRVVKNAAGFSMQHLLLGSLGRLGVLVELNFKVFPRPPARRTIAAEFDSFARALDALVRLRRSTFEPDAAELLPAASALTATAAAIATATAAADRLDATSSARITAAADAATAAGTDNTGQGGAVAGPASFGDVGRRDATLLVVRLAGIETALDARAAALTTFLGADRITSLTPADADAFWHAARELTWCLAPPPAASSNDARAASLVKVPITPSRIARLEEQLRQHAPVTASAATDARLLSGANRVNARPPSASPPFVRGMTPSADAPAAPGALAGAGEDVVQWRYGAGGELAWIAWPGPLDPLHRLLRDSGLQGLVLTGREYDRGGHRAGGEAQASPLIGAPSDTAFLARVRQALDPRGVFA
jgi:FAD/FMN-containing dehydrogenase